MSEYLEQVFKDWLSDYQIGNGRWSDLSDHEIKVLVDRCWQEFKDKYNSDCKQGYGITTTTDKVNFTTPVTIGGWVHEMGNPNTVTAYGPVWRCSKCGQMYPANTAHFCPTA